MKKICITCGQIIQEVKPRGIPRTTGPRSQNHRIRGFCAAISEQVRNPLWTPDTVHDYMKILAVQEGKWPGLQTKRGVIIPISEAKATMEAADGLIAVIQKFADEENLWLYEYDEIGQVYKSLGGRTHAEMVEYERKHGKVG